MLRAKKQPLVPNSGLTGVQGRVVASPPVEEHLDRMAPRMYGVSSGRGPVWGPYAEWEPRELGQGGGA